MLNSQKRLFLFRADASPIIGSGHIMRCLSLANALKATGVDCVFISRHITQNLTQLLKTSGHDTLKIDAPSPIKSGPPQGEYAKWLGTTQEADARDVINVIKSGNYRNSAFDLIICDHYALGEDWEQPVSKALNAPVAAIDDLSNRKHASQWLIDTTFDKTAADYAGLVSPDCTMLIGSQYALLRPEFLRRRAEALRARDKAHEDNTSVNNILISMGGMDNDNVSCWVLSAIKSSGRKDFTVDVLLGASAPHIQEVRAFAKTLSFPVTVHIGVSDVTPLLVNADLCIGAAGSSTWERCCLGLPTINIVIADNQKTIAKTLADTGSILDAGIFDDIRNNTKDFNNNVLLPCLNDAGLRHSMSLSCRVICDGRGIGRIVRSVSVRTVKHAKRVALREAGVADIRMVYDWQALPQTRRYANNTDIPSFESHTAWIQNKLTDEQCMFYIIEYDANPAGSVRLDINRAAALSSGPPAATISIFISPKFFGNGIASAALDIIANLHREIEINAQVHEDNVASLKLFARANYVAQGDGWHRLPPRKG